MNSIIRHYRLFMNNSTLMTRIVWIFVYVRVCTNMCVNTAFWCYSTILYLQVHSSSVVNSMEPTQVYSLVKQEDNNVSNTHITMEWNYFWGIELNFYTIQVTLISTHSLIMKSNVKITNNLLWYKRQIFWVFLHFNQNKFKTNQK